MRGRRRLTVLLVWATVSCGAAALVGGALGALATLLGVPAASGAVSATLIAAAAVADLAGVTPPSIRRQVPQVWGRILDPHVTAVLYGTRLGIGPATMLSTWLWWAATLVGASLGASAAATVGIAFAATRTAVHAAVASRVDRLPAWQRRGRHLTRGLEVTAAVLGILVLVAGCSGDDEVAEPSATTATAAIDEAPDDGAETGADPTTEPTVPETSTPEPALGDELPEELPGYAPITDRPGADTALDLDAAAASEVDPEAERTLLETRAFQAGHTRAWRGDGDRIAVATAYRFGTPEDAALYLQDGLITLDGFAVPSYEVAAIPGARGFTRDDPDGYRTQGIVFVRDDRWYLVYVNGPPETSTTEEAQRLAAIVDPGG